MKDRRGLDRERSEQQTFDKIMHIRDNQKLQNKLYQHEFDSYLDCLTHIDDLTVERQARIANLFKRITGRNIV
tara:strand:- start:411 stop:629 length:219 start_codon:yes stop_codon:yes gene_type:complete